MKRKAKQKDAWRVRREVWKDEQRERRTKRKTWIERLTERKTVGEKGRWRDRLTDRKRDKEKDIRMNWLVGRL